MNFLLSFDTLQKHVLKLLFSGFIDHKEQSAAVLKESNLSAAEPIRFEDFLNLLLYSDRRQNVLCYVYAPGDVNKQFPGESTAANLPDVINCYSRDSPAVKH